MNQLKTILFLGVLSALLIAAGGALGPGALRFAVIMAVVMNIGGYFFSDRLVLAMHRAREINRHDLPWLHDMVEELAARAGIPKPRLYLIPAPYPNAFATGRNPSKGVVAVTEGILHLLSQRELRGVIAHEIAHIRNRDILIATIAATFAAAISYLGNMAFFFGGRSDDRSGSGVHPLVVMLLAPLAATLVQLAISRSREYIADETGARLAGDPEALASALDRLHAGAKAIPSRDVPATASLFIVNPFAGAGGLMHLFSTHPPVAERIRRLRGLRF